MYIFSALADGRDNKSFFVIIIIWLALLANTIEASEYVVLGRRIRAQYSGLKKNGEKF